jgi:hypothetical protein
LRRQPFQGLDSILYIFKVLARRATNVSAGRNIHCGELQKITHLPQREAKIAASPQEVQALKVLVGVQAVVAGRSIAFRQQTGLFVVPDGDDFDTRLLRQIADSEKFCFILTL